MLMKSSLKKRIEMAIKKKNFANHDLHVEVYLAGQTCGKSNSKRTQIQLWKY